MPKKPSIWNRFKSKVYNALGGNNEARELRKLVNHLRRKQIRARYESAQTTDENENHWTLADDYSPSESLTPEVRKKIRKRARYEARENNSYINGICNTLIDETLGRGPINQFPDMKLKDALAIRKAFQSWMVDTGMLQKVRQMCLAEVIEGESIGVFITNENSRNPVKLDIKVLEPDYLEPLWQDQVTYPDAIRFDDDGNPLAYHLLEDHPGSGTGNMSGTWVPAEQVIHLFRQERAGQVRGVSRLAPCLNLTTMLRRFTLATVEAAETAASLAAIMYSDTDPEACAELGEDEWFDAIPLIHRALMTVPTGWKVEQMNPEHPASTYAEFKRELMNEICRCLGMPLNIALANSSGYNYSSGRLDHLTFYRGVSVEQVRYERVIWNRIFNEWYREAYLLGIVPKRITPEKMTCFWTWDRVRTVDEFKETQADKEKLKAGMMSLSAYYAAQGKNWEEEVTQIAKEHKLISSLGLTLDIIMPEPMTNPNGPNNPNNPQKPKPDNEQDSKPADEE